MVSADAWWTALTLRPEIVDASGAIDDVQMSLFQAVHPTGLAEPPYADASYFGDITYPTGQLVDLLAKVAVRLGSDGYTAAPALRRLDQGMGGGKSHACIGCWHLATHPQTFAETEIGRAVFAMADQIAGKPVQQSLGDPHVVVLACDNLTPGAPDKLLDGPAETLYERFLWRLFDRDYKKYETYRPFFNDKSKIGEALRAAGRPVLIIVDELLDYIGNGLDGAGDPELTAQDMAFLRALLDSVNDVPRVAMLVVMIASEKDSIALSRDGERRREDLGGLLERNGQPATVNENADFAAILRRRLFTGAPDPMAVSRVAQDYAKAMSEPAWKSKVFDTLPASWVGSFQSEVARTYPFHPQLMHLAENEWANMAGFQKVRSTIRVFAATVFALAERGRASEWVPELIGPGDLPLSVSNVRESVLGSGLISDTRTQANYRSIAQNDIVGLDDKSGAARALDRARTEDGVGQVNPRAAERAATFLFLASVVGSRSSGRRGAAEPEVKAAIMTPTSNGYGLAEADVVIKELVDGDAGLGTVEILPGRGGQPPRYFLSTTQTLAILIRAARNVISDADRDGTIARLAEELSNTGLFRKKRFIGARSDVGPIDVISAAGIDDARTTRLVILDPAQFSLRNGMEHETLAAIEAVLGLGDERLPVEWAASAVFAVVNTQRRQQARALATNFLAHDSVLGAPEMAQNPDMRAIATRARDDALGALKEKLRSAYQHVVYLSQPDPSLPRSAVVETFESDLQSALDGTAVWKLMVARDRAFAVGEFTGATLEHNLREDDFGRPLNEIRDAFWSAPRLPLLPDGEEDIRRAIFESVASGSLRLTDASANDVAVLNASEINLSQSGLRLQRRDKKPSERGAETQERRADGAAPSVVLGPSPELVPRPDGPLEQSLTFSLATAATSTDSADQMAAVFLAIYEAVDEGAISWIQGSLTLVGNADTTNSLKETLRSASIQATIRPQ